MRERSPKEYCHEELGETFASSVSMYDTNRRIEVLIDQFMGQLDLRGKITLDIGCGLGFFSRRLVERGAEVIACDLGPNLVERAMKLAGCQGRVVDVLELDKSFAPESVDLIVSSECIEHTPNPHEAIRQMGRVLKPGGYLSLSTPNLLWYPPVWLATRLKLRPYDALENFSTWPSLRKDFERSGVEVTKQYGLHLFPFQIPLHGLSRACDENLQMLRFFMANLCLLGRKPDRATC